MRIISFFTYPGTSKKPNWTCLTLGTKAAGWVDRWISTSRNRETPFPPSYCPTTICNSIRGIISVIFNRAFFGLYSIVSIQYCFYQSAYFLLTNLCNGSNLSRGNNNKRSSDIFMLYLSVPSMRDLICISEKKYFNSRIDLTYLYA